MGRGRGARGDPRSGQRRHGAAQLHADFPGAQRAPGGGPHARRAQHGPARLRHRRANPARPRRRPHAPHGRAAQDAEHGRLRPRGDGAHPGAGALSMRLGIVASRFNEKISAELLQRALAEAKKLGAEAAVTSVPGALEIPLALQWLAQSGRFDALVAVGCVIRGDTYHFEVVSNESARGVMDVSLECGLPVANGILTTEDEAQAKARLDKGAEAVRVAVEKARLRTSCT